MDQPGLDDATHRAALMGIERVNRMSRIAKVLWKHVACLATGRDLATVRILDLACGGGDLAIQLARMGSCHRPACRVDGYDISHTAVAHAKAQAMASNTRNVRFFVGDVLSESFNSLAEERYDIVMCSLFLHHLEEQQVVHLLRKMASVARHAVIVDDLQRTRLGYGLAWLGCRLLTRSPMVHVDGPLSVQGAFTVSEARSLARRAGLPDIRIVKHWPQRFLMIWQKTGGTGYENDRH
jgi:2-polyprenyl-3-methyl-5-hydroxy-6-metoxy-1,4-benzoquinol methylase